MGNRKKSSPKTAKRKASSRKTEKAMKPATRKTALQQAEDQIPARLVPSWERFKARRKKLGVGPFDLIGESHPQYLAVQKVDNEYRNEYQSALPEQLKFWKGETQVDEFNRLEDVIPWLEECLRLVRSLCDSNLQVNIDIGIELGKEALSNLRLILKHLAIDERPPLPKSKKLRDPDDVVAALDDALIWVKRKGTGTYSSPQNYARDQWIYDHVHQNSCHTLSLKLKKKAKTEKWTIISSRNGFKKGADRYADFHKMERRRFKDDRVSR